MINVRQADDGTPEFAVCRCGSKIPWEGPGSDFECLRCGNAYNSAGQHLAPRSQWGKETGETAADYDQGVANPWRAFDDY